MTTPATWPPAPGDPHPHDLVYVDLGSGPAWYQVEHIGYTDAGQVYWLRPVHLDLPAANHY